MNLSLLVRLCMLLLLAGCTVVPNVRYHRIDSVADVDRKQFDSYSLQQNMLKLDVGRDAKTGEPDFSTYSVTSVPAEYMAFKLGLTHADAWGVRTTLTLTKRQNTDLVEVVGSTVSDERVELIAKVGGVISKAVGLAALDANAPEPVKYPLLISALYLLEQNNITTDGKKDVPVDGAFTIDFAPLPKDARPISQLPLNERTSAFVYAACRTADVKNKHSPAGDYRKTVKIADPRYFQTVRFPFKGNITAHSECGVSAAADAITGVKSNAAIAEAVIAQVIAVEKALADRDAGK